MRKMIVWLRRMPVLCVIWTAVCYTMGAGAWLSWWSHLTPGVDSVTSDLISMVVGYLLQAGGIWLTILILKKKKKKELFPWVLGSIFLFVTSAMLSLLSQSLASMLFWGLLMNLVDGVITGFYLYIIFIHSENNTHGLLFGCGYALLTPLMYFLALVGNGSFFSQPLALWVYLGMAVLAGGMAYPLFSGKPGKSAEAALGLSPVVPAGQTEVKIQDEKQAASTKASGASPSTSSSSPTRILISFTGLGEKEHGIWVLALFVLFLFSIVKNLGFSFPSSDIITGTNVEFSRLFYGAGLVAAGLIHARSPKTSAICALASLAISFVMLAMEGEPILRVVFWGLDYFFFAFVSVYRVALPMDLARSSVGQGTEGGTQPTPGRGKATDEADSITVRNDSLALIESSSVHALPLALMGLLAGRVGDAIGTLLCVSLAGSKLWLILLTLALFVVAIFLFFRLYLALYLPKQEKERSEREVFADFAIQHDLSDREKEVLRLLLSGQSNGQIAEALFVTESTVKFHVHNLLQKTGCKSRKELTEKFHMLLFPQITRNLATEEAR